MLDIRNLRPKPGSASAPAAPPPIGPSHEIIRDGRRAGVVRDLQDHAGLPDDITLAPLGMFAETAMGEPLVWPRAYRDAQLAKLDKSTTWLAKRAPDAQAAIEAAKQALRDMPEKHPDPATVADPAVWPALPACITDPTAGLIPL